MKLQKKASESQKKKNSEFFFLQKIAFATSLENREGNFWTLMISGKIFGDFSEKEFFMKKKCSRFFLFPRKIFFFSSGLLSGVEKIPQKIWAIYEEFREKIR